MTPAGVHASTVMEWAYWAVVLSGGVVTTSGSGAMSL